MEKIDERWPEGIRIFWEAFNKLSELGERSGFYPEEGRLEICRCFNRQLDENILKEKEYIRVLVIRKNELNEESYQIISKLTNLEKLILESVGQRIEEFDVQELKKLTDVEIKSASNTELPKWILQIPNLENLNISNTRIEGFPDCTGYSGYKKWKKIDISYTAIDNLPDFSNGKLNQLRELCVANTGIEKIPSGYITKALRILDCSSTHISSLKNLYNADRLEVFRCSDNSYLESLDGLWVNGLRVMDVSHCMRLRSLPDAEYGRLDILAVCGDFFDSLPTDLLKHCIDKRIEFREKSIKNLKDLDYDKESLDEKGVYIEGTYFRQMDFRYLLDNDSKFLNYYIGQEMEGKLQPRHETRIMLLEDTLGVGDIFLKKLFPEHPQIYYMEYGGLRVLDVAGGELDYIRRKLDFDVGIDIWTIRKGMDEQFMHSILFSDHDFFIIVLEEKEGANYYEHALYWLKEIEQYVKYATVAFAVVGTSGKGSAILSLKEIKLECSRKYFRFLDEVCNVNIKDVEAYIELTEWLVEGIRGKSNYEMKILPEWKGLRAKIVSYLDLRRVVNQERFESLIPLNKEYEKRAFVKYLRESKSLSYTCYSQKENYFFKAEWVISAVFALIRVLRKGVLNNPFRMDELRVYLQTEAMDQLDFFQDPESLRYLMDFLEDTGAVYKEGNKYYGLLALPYMPTSSSVYKTLQTSEMMTYKAEYALLTEQMVTKITAALLGAWGQINENVENVLKFKDYLVFQIIDRKKHNGDIVARIITGCPGKIMFYIVEDDTVKKGKAAKAIILRNWLIKFLGVLENSQTFPLWHVEISLYYMVNGIGSFISWSEIKSYARSGHAPAFIPRYNAMVDIDEIIKEFDEGLVSSR